MKLLHTSDWHVGKVLKNRSRHDEHVAVLGNLVRIANEEDVDAVVIAGDLFDSSAPSSAAQGLVVRTLLDLRSEGREVIALAGNHDNQQLIDNVYRPLLGEVGIHVVGVPRRPDAGGALQLRTRAGERLNVGVLPFLSHRHAVRAAEALLHEMSAHTLDYSNRVKAMIEQLTSHFTGDAVNLVTTHGTLLGGRRGGGERDVQTTLDYELSALMFPTSTSYVAMGHLHRAQEINGPCPIHYSGSPLAIDFGEEANNPVALIVTAPPAGRAVARPVPLLGGRPLVTLHGTLDHVVAASESHPDAYLRIILDEKGRAGLGDIVRDKLPNTLEVQLSPAHRPGPSGHGKPSRVGRSPSELFADYLADSDIEDERLTKLFTELLDEVTEES